VPKGKLPLWLKKSDAALVRGLFFIAAFAPAVKQDRQGQKKQREAKI
jgi:hypothetical protein